jgi:hypothetical protein
MDTVKKGILTILFMLIVMAYTVINYASGKIDFVMFVVCMAIMGIPMLNMINLLIQEWKKK